MTEREFMPTSSTKFGFNSVTSWKDYFVAGGDLITPYASADCCEYTPVILEHRVSSGTTQAWKIDKRELSFYTSTSRIDYFVSIEQVKIFMNYDSGKGKNAPKNPNFVAVAMPRDKTTGQLIDLQD